MTDTKTSNIDTRTENTQVKQPEPKKLFDMSASQLVGGALAAMTSAVIGARLGVAGTVVGAAVGSIVAGIAGTLYTTSIKRTKDKISSVIVGKVGDTKVEIAPASVASTSVRQANEDTAVWDWDTSTTDSTIVSETPAAAAPPSPAPVAADTVVDNAGRTTKRLPWKPILASTAAAFVLAFAGITGYELVSGQAISGGEGTTLTQVSEGGSGSTDDEPSQAPSSTPSDDTTTEPSSEPSASSEPTSSASSEPSTQPSESTEPSETAEPSASSEPTASETPSTASDEQGAADSGESDDEGAVAGG